jgi:formylglycine-generating enzyme required for sulfatase activity
VGPERGDARVLRGGSWIYSASRVRSARRDGQDPAKGGAASAFVSPEVQRSDFP